MTEVIRVAGLRKRFGTTKALDGLDLAVHPGEVHGFLGPNGAGKSTTLRILLGMLRPDAGEVDVLGGTPWRDAVSLNRRIAYLPGDVQLWPTLTGGETIDLLARLRGVSDGARRDRLVERFDLDASKRGRVYSKGNRQKVALIAALAADVELYVLDEPTDGLDPLMAEVFREEVASLRDAGRTVLLSSHVLGEVEALADRVTIIRAGRAVETGTLGELRHLSRTAVEAVTISPVPAAQLAQLDGVHDLTVDGARGERVRCQADAAGLDPLLRVLGAAGLQSLQVHPPTLEDLFREHYATGPVDPASMS